MLSSCGIMYTGTFPRAYAALGWPCSASVLRDTTNQLLRRTHHLCAV